MLKQIRIAVTTLGWCVLSSAIAAPARSQLTIAEMDSLASQTTVLIARQLTQDLLDELEENRNNPERPHESWNPGSGVIIAREGRTYYVLTVTHNFKQPTLDRGDSYGIRTSDGEVHQIQEINDNRGCPLTGNSNKQQRLVRFGCYSTQLDRERPVVGADLAVVRFESDKDYPVATLGNPETVGIGDRVYVSGWPDPEKEKNPEAPPECRGQVKRRERRLMWSPLYAKVNYERSEYGYGIFYFDRTRVGMSGGPVFDENGRVIGVHGRGSNEVEQTRRTYCSLSAAPDTLDSSATDVNAFETTGASAEELYEQFSSAQSVAFFLDFVAQDGLSFAFNRALPDRETIEQNLNALDVEDTPVGFIDDEIGAIEDIYEIYNFSLGDRLREDPGGRIL